MTPRADGLRTRAVEVVFWCAVAAQYVWCLCSYDGLTMGDGFIVARYAENLVDHGELAFNLGERIWSFTSPLHTLLVAGYYALTGASIAANQIASIVCVLGAFALTARFVCRDFVERLLAAIVLLLSPCLVFWTTAGLETAYLTLFVSALVAVRFRAEGASLGPGHVALVCSLSALAFLTRYDASLFAVPAVVAAFHGAGVRPKTLLAAAPPAGLAAAWVLFSLGYYDALLPTSFYAKTPSFRTGLGRNAVYVAQFVVVSALPWVVASGIAAGRSAAGPPAGSRAGFGGHAWLLAGLLLTFVYALSAATKHMMFSYRLLIPYLPALFAAALLWRRALARRAGASERRAGVLLVCVAAMACQALVQLHVQLVGVNPSFVGEFRRFGAERMKRYSNEVWDPLADDLERHWTQREESARRAPRLYTWEAGQMPYRMRDLHVYDNGLISWRHRCALPSMASADYILVWPGNPKPSGPVQVVTVRDVPTSPGRTAGAFVLYWNRSPQPHRLPPRIGEPCPEPRRHPAGTK